MTIYLVGHRGWLGRAVQQAIPGAVGVGAADVLAAGMGAFPTETIAPGSVLVNVAGAKRGEDSLLYRLNTQLPGVLADLAQGTGARVVHVGSAAEYGLRESPSSLTEAADCAPDSAYGRTKLAGTRLLLESGRACVLRVFNIASGPPQEGSPLADVAARVRAAIDRAAPVELLSAETGRDWVSRDFVVRSISKAATGDTIGVFNVSSGRVITMRELAMALAHELGFPVPVKDLGLFPATSISGDPQRWRTTAGLAESLAPPELASVVLQKTGSGDRGGGPR